MKWIAAVLLVRVALASPLDPQQTVRISDVDPREACPGYKADNVQQTENGLNARLTLAGKSCDVFGKDISSLNLKVTLENENRLRVIIEDAKQLQFQIPEWVLPQPPVKKGVKSCKLKFDYKASPFSFTVSRTSGDVIFDSSAAGLVFEDQYIRLRTSLPKDPNLYGLAEHADSMRLQTKDYVRTMWNRDAFGTGTRQNLYSSHPVYFEHRGDRGTHGVFLRNSNGMDVIINQTVNGDQFLEYNLIGGVLDLSFLAGPAPVDVSKQYAEVVGLPAMSPYWAFGFNQCRYGYRDAFEVAEVIANYSNAGIPLETMWIDIDYMYRRRVFTNDNERYPLSALREIANYLHSHGQKLTVMVDPGVAVNDTNNPAYTHGKELGVFAKMADGQDFQGVVWPGVTVWPDWFHPEVGKWWTTEFTNFFNPATGFDIDQCWIDMSDPSNFGCEFGCNPQEVVAKSDNFPPEPPPVRKPPRPLPGWSCAFQPEGTKCELASVMYPQPVPPMLADGSKQQRRAVKPHSDKPQGDKPHTGETHGGNNNSTEIGKFKGLPGRDLLYPKYSIHNMWAYMPSWNGDKGGLSNFTVRTDVIHANGVAEYDVHNLYGHMMTMFTRKALLARRPNSRPSIVGRSTSPGTGRHGGKWTGDNYSSWFHYLLTIRSCVSFAILQNPFVGVDTCGFGGNTSESLCARWAMLSAFTPFYRNHNDLNSIPQEYYRWASVTAAAKKAIDMRYRLLDYMYTALWRQTVDGTPILSPMWFKFPGDSATFAIETQFYNGPALLVAPVVEESSNTAQVYMPRDAIFYDWYTGSRLIGGGANVYVPNQGLTDMPLYVAGGNIVPLRIKSAMTTAEVRKQNFELLVALAANKTARGELYLDDGDSLEQAKTSHIIFTYENNVLRVSGKYDYITSCKITRFTFLGTDVKIGSTKKKVEVVKDGVNSQIKVDVSLDGDFELEVIV